MKNNNTSANSCTTLRYGLFIPMAFMIASVITFCFSYSNAKQNITNDLNDAMFALANENCELWTRPDTIAAIRHMHEITHKPLIYQASDVKFRNSSLKDEAYFTLALVDNNNGSHRIGGNKIVSDSIVLVPKRAANGIAIQVQGFADCSIASVFYASDKTLPGILFSLSILSMMCVCAWQRKNKELPEKEVVSVVASQAHPLDGLKLLLCNDSLLGCFLRHRI